MASKSMTSTASPAAAKRPKSAIRHQILVNSVDNYHLLTNLLDLLDGGSSGAAVQQEESASPSSMVQPMLDSSG